MAERSLGEWLQYLERLHPSKIDLGLERVATVARRLGLLPFPARVVTVAGTNGKGSVVYSTEAVLRHSGLRTGLYTSPHLLAYNERIVVAGEPAEDTLILAAFEAIEAARQAPEPAISLSYFEFATLAALWVFREQNVDVAILEVGLGGRLDAVNIVDADFAVITAIDLDHQDWLGDTVELIAAEKAGIARRGCPAVLAEHDYPSTLTESLASIGALEDRAGQHWDWTEEDGELRLRFSPSAALLRFPIPPGLRAGNVAAALRVCEHLLGKDFAAPRVAAALAGLSIPGRRQRLEYQQRELILDVAHNPAAMHALAEYLIARPIAGQSIAVLGVMGDKDIAGICQELATAVDGACALAIPGIDRAAAPERIWEALDAEGIAIPQEEFTLERVLAQLLEGTEAGDRLVVCGSFHTVAGIMALLGLPVQPAAVPGDEPNDALGDTLNDRLSSEQTGAPQAAARP